MATILVITDIAANCLIFEVEGPVRADDIISVMERNYVAGAPVHAIWDYSAATFHEMGPDDYARIAAAAKALAPLRPGGRTAFVVPGSLEAVAIRMFEASSKLVDLPIPLHTCATRDEAIAWMASSG